MFYKSYCIRGNRAPYRAIFKYKDDDGKWHQISRTLQAATKREAQREAKELHMKLEDEADLFRLRKSCATTVPKFLAAYVDRIEQSRSVERTTINGYRTIVKNVEEGLSGVLITQLTPEHVQRWETQLLERGLSPRSVRKAHVLLKAACEEAVYDELIPKNPLKRIRPPKVTRPQPNSLTDAQRRKLLTYLDMAADTPFNLAVQIALMTGMRQGEICGLRWGDVDFMGGTIWVRRAVARDSGKTYVKTPKTRSSIRDIPIADALAEVLMRRYRSMQSTRLEAGLDASPEAMMQLYVIGEVDGSYHNVHMIWKQWNALAKSLGLVGTQGTVPSFHDLRHTFATYAIAEGVDVKTVSSILGHANASMTLDVYASADPNSKRAAAKTIDEVMSRRIETLPSPVMGASMGPNDSPADQDLRLFEVV